MEFLLLMLVLLSAKGGGSAPLGDVARLLKSEPVRSLRIGSATAGELAEAAERFSALTEEGGILRAFAEGKADFAGLNTLAQLFGAGAPPVFPPPQGMPQEAPCNPFAPIAPFAPAEFVCALNRCFA